MRNTENHEWPIPEEEDEDYDVAFDDFIDALDKETSLAGKVENRPEPEGDERLFLAVDTGELFFEDGNSWEQVHPEVNFENYALAYLNRNMRIFGEWRTDEAIDADIEGEAYHAETANSALIATNTRKFDNVPSSSFIYRGAEATIRATWKFNKEANLENGCNVSGGVLKLPVYGPSN